MILILNKLMRVNLCYILPLVLQLVYCCGCVNAQKDDCLNLHRVNDFITNQYQQDTAIREGFLLDSISVSINYYYNIDSLNQKLDTFIFSDGDIVYLNCQARLLDRHFAWKGILNNTKFVISDKIVEQEITENDWESYRDKYGRGFYTYSIPLFSKNGERAIMIKKYTCGPFCGYTKVLVFQKSDSVWKVFWEKTKGKK